METHDPDPTTESPSDPWDSATAEFSGIGRRIKETYRKVADDRGPSEEEIKQAFSTLAGAWDQVAESVTAALKDPAIREQLKNAVGSFASAVGSTVTDLGSELRRDTTVTEEE